MYGGSHQRDTFPGQEGLFPDQEVVIDTAHGEDVHHAVHRLEKLFRPTTSFLKRSKSEIIPVLVLDRDEHVLWIDVPVGDVEAVDVGEVLYGLSEHIPHHVLVLVTLPQN